MHHQNNFKLNNIMCIRLNSIKDCPKVAESDITTYKILLEVVEDVTTGKKSYYSPISINRLQYNVGEQYTEPIGKTENVLGIEDGLETCICVKTTTGLYSYRDLDVAVTFLQIIEDCVTGLPMAPKYKIFQCKVPKGSKYYSESKGSEIVSDNLIILSQVSLN